MPKRILQGVVITSTSDKTIVVEATLSNGNIINPYTGKAPILTSLNYPDLWNLDKY